MTKKKRDFEKENDRMFGWARGIVFVIILILFLQNEPWRDRGCYLNEYSIFERSFSGKVIRKYIDYRYSATPTLTLTPNSKTPIMKGEYYEKIEVGDSVSKMPNSFLLEIHKLDTVIYCEYKYQCNE